MVDFDGAGGFAAGVVVDMGDRNEQAIKRLLRLRRMLLATAIVLIIAIVLLVLLFFGI